MRSVRRLFCGDWFQRVLTEPRNAMRKELRPKARKPVPAAHWQRLGVRRRLVA